MSFPRIWRTGERRGHRVRLAAGGERFLVFRVPRLESRRTASSLGTQLVRGALAGRERAAASRRISPAAGSKWSTAAMRWPSQRAIFTSDPDERVLFTGITGTNGKTTTSYLIDAILREAGSITGLIGTIEYRLAGERLPAANTTPESLDVYALCGGAGTGAAEPLRLQWKFPRTPSRWDGSTGFDFTPLYSRISRAIIWIFTTRWKTTPRPSGCCSRLEDRPPPDWAVLNADDPATAHMAAPASRAPCCYGSRPRRELRAKNISSGFDGLRFDLRSGKARASRSNRRWSDGSTC